MPLDAVTRVTRNRDLGNGSFLLEFEAAEMVRDMRPAQFFMIGVPGAEMLLRRPFSVCGLPGTFADATPGTAQILGKVVGKGTALLAALREGAELAVLGPLGKGFALPERGRIAVFVAGGIGSAPFPAQVAALREAAAQRPRMLYGARTAGDLPLCEWFDERCDLVVSTEDGSRGVRGRVTDPLEEMLSRGDTDRWRIQACGPEPMLRAVAELARRYAVPCELSLEAHMACGFGVCLGCVVPTRDGPGGTLDYARICVDGPVMPAERLAW